MIRVRCPLVLFMFVMLISVLSVNAQPVEPPPDQTQKMSLDVKETDIRDVIRMISKGYGLNIILDRDVTGSVTSTF